MNFGSYPTYPHAVITIFFTYSLQKYISYVLAYFILHWSNPLLQIGAQGTVKQNELLEAGKELLCLLGRKDVPLL